MRNRWGPALLALGLLAGPAPAHALTLLDLVGGGSFSSLDGSLAFDGFAGSGVSGALHPDLGHYTIVPLDGGFRVSGPIGVADGNAGALALRYRVRGTGALVGADVFFNASVFGDAAFADLASALLQAEAGPGVPGDSALNLLVDGGGTKIKLDAAGFDPIAELFVDEEVRVGSEGGLVATISVVEHRFAVVPEPASALLLGVGLAAVAVARRRR